MTGQDPELFEYQDSHPQDHWSLVGVSDKSQLFTPEQFGMEFHKESTANYRGYVSTHTIVDNKLVLKKVHVKCVPWGDDKNKPIAELYKPINGVLPVAKKVRFTKPWPQWVVDQKYTGKYDTLDEYLENYEWTELAYWDIGLVVEFTGVIRIGAGFIEENYVHMGFQKASAFKTVVDLMFEKGVLVKATDISDKVHNIDKKFKDKHGFIPDGPGIGEAFSMDMGLE